MAKQEYESDCVYKHLQLAVQSLKDRGIFPGNTFFNSDVLIK